MNGCEPRVLLKHCPEQGLSKKSIAERTGVSRRTIYHWIETGQLERDLDADTARYLPRPTGYPGSLTQLKLFVRKVRPLPPPEEIIRFETLPGHQAQVDFAQVWLPWRKRFALMVVLGQSRLLWLQFYPWQTMSVPMRGLEEAFPRFGGAPPELFFDQLKAVIVEDRRSEGGRVLENPEFLRFAAHWGFRIRACRPQRARAKGKVEGPIGYVRKGFLYAQELAGDADLNARALHWLATVANVRIHGTSKCAGPSAAPAGSRSPLSARASGHRGQSGINR